MGLWEVVINSFWLMPSIFKWWTLKYLRKLLKPRDVCLCRLERSNMSGIASISYVIATIYTLPIMSNSNLYACSLKFIVENLPIYYLPFVTGNNIGTKLLTKLIFFVACRWFSTTWQLRWLPAQAVCLKILPYFFGGKLLLLN